MSARGVGDGVVEWINCRSEGGGEGLALTLLEDRSAKRFSFQILRSVLKQGKPHCQGVWGAQGGLRIQVSADA